MHKKLENELVSIAHSILQMKNRKDAIALRQKAQQLYEKLSVLTFIDSYIETTPNASETKEELVAQFEEKVTEQEIAIDTTNENTETLEIELPKIAIAKKEEIEVEIPIFTLDKVIETPKKQVTLEEEFKDTISVDITTDLFQKVVPKEVQPKTVITETKEKDTDIKTSLNDTLMQSNIQVGLNDRIAFVKHLFGGSQEDFNRVLSQLNTFKTENEAVDFVQKMVKPDYNWSAKEEYEERFITLIERKFT